MHDVTRDTTQAMKQGARDVRVYGWPLLHFMVMETNGTKGWSVQSMFFGFALQFSFQVIR